MEIHQNDNLWFRATTISLIMNYSFKKIKWIGNYFDHQILISVIFMWGFYVFLSFVMVNWMFVGFWTIAWTTQDIWGPQLRLRDITEGIIQYVQTFYRQTTNWFIEKYENYHRLQPYSDLIIKQDNTMWLYPTIGPLNWKEMYCINICCSRYFMDHCIGSKALKCLFSLKLIRLVWHPWKAVNKAAWLFPLDVRSKKAARIPVA